ncbi:MAG: Ig-like domain-containing protein [Coriobacteriales bacterium]|jgi:uncharacterized protein YjdB|nr:Ig-like domain-containing protein [Coriobacteriales bacterium]
MSLKVVRKAFCLLFCCLLGLALALGPAILPISTHTRASKASAKLAFADATPTYTIHKSSKAKAKADSVTEIGDSVPLGAQLFAGMPRRIAKVSGISWCKADNKGSRELPAGLKVVSQLKKKHKLGSIVVIALSTNHWYTYSQAKKARKTIGTSRDVVFVTGYYRGLSYPQKSRQAALKMAKHYSNCYVADWYKFITAKSSKKLSDHCHLTATSGKWYGDVVIKAIKQIRKDKTAQAQKKALASVGVNCAQSQIYLGMGSSVYAPAALSAAFSSGAATRWQSSDSTVCRVDASGLLTAVRAGSAQITLTKTTGSDKSLSFRVTVTPELTPASFFALSRVAMGSSVKPTHFRLAMSATPTTASGVVTFSSSNSKVAKVSRAGVVYGYKAGICTVTASFGSLRQSLKVKVK